MRAKIAFTVFLGLVLVAARAWADGDYFKIQVVDEQTGRGVPLVELKTVNGIRQFTDSRGVIAFREPGLMGQRVFFHVASHGYEFPKDGFGYRGRALKVEAGGRAVLKIKRINLAERLYRVTGGGAYRDSVLVGEADRIPVKQPLLNASVLGSDSVVNARLNGKLYWFWGDTNRPGYPLGNFHVPGATSLLPEAGGLPPDQGVELRYFAGRDGFAKPTAQMPGKGPTWIDGLATLPDAQGKESLVAHYVKVKPPLSVYQHGLIEFDPVENRFRKLKELDPKSPVFPGGHSFRRVENGVDYVYFANPFPLLRVRATVEDYQRLDRYEAFTCLESGSRRTDLRISRNSAGAPLYRWRRDAPLVGSEFQAKLINQGRLKSDEVLLQLRDARTGKRVMAHRGSVEWNEFRGRWVLIACEKFGTSLLGEVWLAEADSPVGPWTYAVKVVTHDRYSFYNPKQHPYFAHDKGRAIYFEGTYTTTFSGNTDKTPRYDYNQIMYRLNLDDPRTYLPSAVYRRESGKGRPNLAGRTRSEVGAQLAFFAHDRRADKSAIGLWGATDERGYWRLTRQQQRARPLFYALPMDLPEPPAATTPLHEFHDDQSGRYYYSTNEQPPEGFQRGSKPICLVWPSPYRQWPLNDKGAEDNR